MAARRVPVAGIVKFISDNVGGCGTRSLRWPTSPAYHNVWRSTNLGAFSSTATSEEVQHASSTSNGTAQIPLTEALERSKKLNLEVETLTNEVKKLKEKAEELEDKYKRALADGENMRLRLSKQVNDARIFGIQQFCKDLLDVSDVLVKATESVPKEEIKDSNPYLKGLYEGLMMTGAELQSVFKRNGLVPVNPLNEKFNPNFHEALFQQDVQGVEPGTVVVVSKIGYKLHERVIRPALVGVAKGP